MYACRPDGHAGLPSLAYRKWSTNSLPQVQHTLASLPPHLQAPRTRLRGLVSVRARNVPAVSPDTVDTAAAYFAVWSHQSTDRHSDVQALPGAYLSEQVSIAQTT